jgi:hypothetical protein
MSRRRGPKWRYQPESRQRVSSMGVRGRGISAPAGAVIVAAMLEKVGRGGGGSGGW